MLLASSVVLVTILIMAVATKALLAVLGVKAERRESFLPQPFPSNPDFTVSVRCYIVSNPKKKNQPLLKIASNSPGAMEFMLRRPYAVNLPGNPAITCMVMSSTSCKST